MTALALALVLCSAVFHATWNLLAKRAGGGWAFLWLSDALAAVIFLPVALWVLLSESAPLNLLDVVFILGSATLHLTYFLLLFAGYRVGDLSLVYPLARGTGPALSTLAAILFFGEHPTLLAMAGAALVVVGVFLLTGGPAAVRKVTNSRAVAFGLLTGVLIAIYTLWDKQAVSALLVPPVLLYWGATTGRVLLLTPMASGQPGAVSREWRTHLPQALGVALLSPASYILVLTALVFTPVSYVAPAREVGILLGTVLGTRLLSEGETARRMVAAATILLGVVALAVG